ncbi:MAG TPA: metallophosphoesterase family protein [Syntrophobacter fumaroxidans]|nr:metallophosphoesterase family protein [Syntrophobacter fumaroxidans]
MRTYFFGDIHGNGYALEAVLQHMDKQKTDALFCLGDLVGWLPFGDRTLQRMRSLGISTVAGNHDLLVCGLFIDHPHQVDRMQATAYNAGLLSSVPQAMDYLSNLPLIFERPEFVVTHHSPFHLPAAEELPTIDCFNYLDEFALTECLSAWHEYPHRLIFSGHDHVPAVFELPDTGEQPRFEDIRSYSPAPDADLVLHLQPGSKYWIKAGSVGGPYRDGVPIANSVLYDNESDTLTLFRVPFPTGQLIEEMLALRFCHIVPTLRKYLELLESRS